MLAVGLESHASAPDCLDVFSVLGTEMIIDLTQPSFIVSKKLYCGFVFK